MIDTRKKAIFLTIKNGANFKLGTLPIILGRVAQRSSAKKKKKQLREISTYPLRSSMHFPLR